MLNGLVRSTQYPGTFAHPVTPSPRHLLTPSSPHSVREKATMQQEQFLDVIDRDEAERRFRAVLDLRPLEAEEVPLTEALNRVLAGDVVAPVDVPSFDRSNVDGFAVRAEDTFGAGEETPRSLRLHAEVLATGMMPQTSIGPGTATAIATGAVMPRGPDAIARTQPTAATDETL